VWVLRKSMRRSPPPPPPPWLWQRLLEKTPAANPGQNPYLHLLSGWAGEPWHLPKHPVSEFGALKVSTSNSGAKRVPLATGMAPPMRAHRAVWRPIFRSTSKTWDEWHRSGRLHSRDVCGCLDNGVNRHFITVGAAAMMRAANSSVAGGSARSGLE